MCNHLGLEASPSKRLKRFLFPHSFFPFVCCSKANRYFHIPSCKTFLFLWTVKMQNHHFIYDPFLFQNASQDCWLLEGAESRQAGAEIEPVEHSRQQAQDQLNGRRRERERRVVRWSLLDYFDSFLCSSLLPQLTDLKTRPRTSLSSSSIAWACFRTAGRPLFKRDQAWVRCFKSRRLKVQ